MTDVKDARPTSSARSDQSDEGAQASLEDDASTRRREIYDKEVKEGQAKYDGGGHNSYPRRQHRLRQKKGGRHISKSAAAEFGSARAGTHDVDAEFQAKDIQSLQKRDRRRKRGPGRHPKRGPALNPSSDHSSNPTRGRAATPGAHSTSTLSPTPVWEVASFVPDRIEIPDVPGDHIMVLGKIPVPQHLLVDFLKKSHHPLAYSCWDRVASTPVGAPKDDRPLVPTEADASTTSLVDAEPSPMTEPTPTAGLAVPSSIAEPTPAAGPTVPSPTVETTPEFGPTVLPSIAEPTPVAESAPAASSSVVDPMPVTESVAEAPSSMAEPTPVAESAPAASSSVVDPMPVTESVAEAPSPTEPVVRPEDVATTPVEGPALAPEGGNNRPPPEEAHLGSSDRDGTAPRSSTGEAARPSVIPSRPGVIHLTDDPAGLVPPQEVDSALPSARDEAGTTLPNDTVGPGSTMASDDDDWVIVELPALPTNSLGGIDFTRVDLANVELVPYLCADLKPWEYGDDDAPITASEDARRSLLTKYLERQLQADRILTISNFDFCAMRAYSDLAPISMTRGNYGKIEVA
ncbi:hypothetical protein THAOC_18365 [Thalassiosira oceanica]|uniref:Uncharacterized protein n=1 Tax=Thalassiosira oceanica TaxID=159749 RepID=K0S7I8_THAOC|nr:hypothetical protein THAOC_18365 [Thalassiosira oceanica]|eukprot:EJK61190.1 hypothetical protein THAOC_18365 [Thalassiosira oceanica]